MPLHVVFVGPDVFSAYTDMCRGLKQAGALVTGIGPSAKGALSPALARHLDHWQQANVGDAGAIADAVRTVHRLRGVDRLAMRAREYLETVLSGLEQHLNNPPG